MKYIKTFENKKRKFEKGDWIIHKSGFELPFIVVDWLPELNEYIVQNVLNNDNMIYINGRYYKLMTPEQIEDWKMKNNVNKYNL